MVSAEADLTEGENDHGAVDVEPSVDSDKPVADVKRTRCSSTAFMAHSYISA